MWRIFSAWFRRSVAASSDDDYVALLQSIGIDCERDGAWRWRCGNCSRMQPHGSVQAMIPDGTRAGDPLWAVLAHCRRWAYNGQYTAWCLRCTRSFKPMTAEEMARADKTPHDPIPTFGVLRNRPTGGARPFTQGMTLGPGESAYITLELPRKQDEDS